MDTTKSAAETAAGNTASTAATSAAKTDPGRRALLLATSGLAGAGMVAATIPFIQTMQPSEAAKAAGAPVEFDVSRVAPGKIETLDWRGKPVWVVHRSDAMLAMLGRHENLLADPGSTQPQQPSYARNATRAVKPPFFIAVGICTHLGCIPAYRPEPGGAELGPEWPGGFYCPCHGSRFDLAGRVFKNVPAPVNLEIPPYRYLTATRVLIGADAG